MFAHVPLRYHFVSFYAYIDFDFHKVFCELYHKYIDLAV